MMRSGSWRCCLIIFDLSVHETRTKGSRSVPLTESSDKSANGLTCTVCVTGMPLLLRTPSLDTGLI